MIERSLVNLLCLILAVCALTSCQNTQRAPRLLFDASVAPDMQELAAKTWSDFLIMFDARSACFGDVHLRVRRDLTKRALYDPVTATVTVRVPGTPAFLQGALVHEWAHHVEFQCDGHPELRKDFLAALSLQPNTPWHNGRAWEDTPSERYAEAVVELVLGEHPLPTKARVNRAAAQVVAEWVKGS